jgi:hypothetical protein
MADPDYDFKSGKQYKTRAVGQLYMGPLKAVGYDNRVLELTLQEVEFKNSIDAERFIDSQRRKLGNKRDLMKQRRMKLRSISSD